MPSFSNILQSIKNPDIHTSATLKPAIKKIKIANNGSHIKSASDVVEAANKRTAPVLQQPAVGAVPKATPKKRKADDTNISVAKPTTKKPKTKTPVAKERVKLDLPHKERDILSPSTKTPAEHFSLERMKEEARKTFEERRGVAQIALDGLLPLIKKNTAIKTAVAVLEQQIDDYDLSIKTLSSLGRELESGKIEGTDSQILLALASCGLAVKTALGDTTSSPPAEAQIKTEGEEDTRFSDETLAAIFGPDDEEKEEHVNYDIFQMAPASGPAMASLQRPVTSTADSPTNSRPAPSRFVEPTKGNKLHLIDASEVVDGMEKAAGAEKKQSPKRKGGVVVQKGGSMTSKVYRGKGGELRFRK